MRVDGAVLTPPRFFISPDSLRFGLRGFHGLGDTCQSSPNTSYILLSAYAQGFAEGCVPGSCADCVPIPSGQAAAAALLANYTPVSFNPAPAASGAPTNKAYNTANNAGANPYAGAPAAIVHNADGSTSIVDQYGQTVYTGTAVAANPSLLSAVPTKSGLIATYSIEGITYAAPSSANPQCNEATGICGSYEIQGATQPVNAGWYLKEDGTWIWTGPGSAPSVNPFQALAINVPGAYGIAPPAGATTATPTPNATTPVGTPGVTQAAVTAAANSAPIPAGLVPLGTTGSSSSASSSTGFTLPAWLTDESIGSIPNWWLLVGGAAALFLFMRRRRASSQPSSNMRGGR